jgi:hypothetical protein
VAITTKYRGCGVWVFAAFWGTLFQPAVSPFNWIRRVIEDVGNKVGCMLSAESSHDRTVEGLVDQMDEEATIDGLTRKCPSVHTQGLFQEGRQDGDVRAQEYGRFEGKNTFI